MKHTLITLLGVGGLLAIAALAMAQDNLPPVYDLTGAMLTAVVPQPTPAPTSFPLVYDSTGAREAAIANGQAQTSDSQSLSEVSLYERLAQQAETSSASSVVVAPASLEEARRLAEAAESASPSLPLVYDSTGVMLTAIVPAESITAPVAETAAVAQPGLDPAPLMVVSGVIVLLIGIVIGVRALTHRPTHVHHGPRHV
ncbi:MAG TPA: hypothetical protein PK954_20465 [Anaerolineales bacterium]|nr:hypothetical protein [Anaerolineales bacterium]HRF49435.1 hypothetical protein [Anaerolineales bacterium]